MKNQPGTMKKHEKPQMTWEGGQGRNKQKRDWRGVTTDLGGGRGRNKQKRDVRGVTTDLWGGQGRNKQKR